MLRLRNAAIVLLIAGATYALAPAERKRRWTGKLRELGRALVVAMILFWILIVARDWLAG